MSLSLLLAACTLLTPAQTPAQTPASSSEYECSEQQKAKQSDLPVIDLTGPPGEWSDFTSKEGRFTVTFPGKPSVETNKDAREARFSLSLENGGIYYLVSYSDVGKDRTEVYAAGVLSNFAERYAKGLKKKQAITVNGFPGIDLVAQIDSNGQKITLHARAFVAGGRVYELFAASDARLAEKMQAQRFLDSFKLQDKASDLDQLIDQVELCNGYPKHTKTPAGQAVLSIQFRDGSPKDADLEKLRPFLQKCPLPIDLNLNGTSLSDTGAAHLKDLGTIVQLRLDRCNMTDAGLARLASLKNLEYLNISGPFTDAGLAHLAPLTKLRELEIHSDKVTPAGYAHLAGLKELEKLHAGGYNVFLDDTCLAAVKEMTKLKEARLGRDKLTDAGMAYVKNLTGLRQLWLEGPKVTAAGLANLAALKQLQKLTIQSCDSVHGDGMAALSGLTELRELDFLACGKLDARATAHLGGLAKLKKLRLDAIADDGLAGIKGLTNLEALDLFYAHLSDAALAPLAGLKGLKTLNLAHCNLTGSGLKHLAGLTNLEELMLAENHIDDDSLKHLAGCTRLTKLYLGDNNDITEKGVKHLGGLTKLTELSLKGTSLADPALATLKGLHHLKELHLTGTKISDEAVLALKKALPKARILDAFGDEVALEKPAPRKVEIEDLTKVPAALAMTAPQFFQEFKSDQKAIVEKYKDKVIELGGVVQTMGQNSAGEALITLKVDKEFSGVYCFTAESQPWAKVVPGQTVKLKGKLPAYPYTPALVHCVFVEIGPSPAVEMTVEQLAREYAADREATTKKYEGKYLRLTGEVVDRAINSAGAVSLYLKCPEKIRLGCHCTAFAKALLRPINVGQQVTMVGEFANSFSAEEIRLNFCLPLKKE